MGRVLVVKAPEGIFWHTVGSGSVQVAVPVDLQCHDSTLPSGGEVMGQPSTRLSADQDPDLLALIPGSVQHSFLLLQNLAHNPTQTKQGQLFM